MAIPEDVRVGDLVDWYPDGDTTQRPHPAVVTAENGLGSVAVNIMGPDTLNFRIRDGVPHVSDPRCRGEHTREFGGWDYGPLMKRLQALEEVMLATA